MSKQVGESIIPYLQGANLVHTGVTLRLEDISVPVAPILSVILAGDFSFAQDNYDYKSFLISAFSYAA